MKTSYLMLYMKSLFLQTLFLDTLYVLLRLWLIGGRQCIDAIEEAYAGVHLNPKSTVAQARPSSKTTLALAKWDSRVIFNLNITYLKYERRRREPIFYVFEINVFRKMCISNDFPSNWHSHKRECRLNDTRADETTVAYATVRPLRCTPAYVMAIHSLLGVQR